MNTEICELNDSELDYVSGGVVVAPAVVLGLTFLATYGGLSLAQDAASKYLGTLNGPLHR